MGAKYVILAGPATRPETVDRGILDKGLGQTVISGDVIKTLNKRADIGIPNYTEAWGVRVIEEDKIPTERIDIKDIKYKGQIKFLKWGHQDGYMIPCRYLRGYNTLDLHYQNVVLNAKETIRDDDESSADASTIRMQSGDNFYDVESDKYLVQMLRIHMLNGSSEFKSSDAVNPMFREIEVGHNDNKLNKIFNDKFEALKIVQDASQDNSLQRVKNLFLIVRVLVDQDVKDDDKYRYLYVLAETKPESFLAQIQQYKKDVSDTFEKFKSYQAFDLTKDGTIVVTQPKKEIVGEDIPAKKEGMLEWILANYTDPKAFNVSFKLKQLEDKLK